LRKSAAVKSGETTPFSSTGSLSSLPNNSRLAAPTPAASGNVGGSGPGQYDVLTNPIYQCMSLPESRAKTLCRKQPQRMLEHTELQLVRVYPAGMRIDSSNFNPIPFWSCGIQMAVSRANLFVRNIFLSKYQAWVNLVVVFLYSLKLYFCASS
jgi:phosphatidylinositol phospholipase C epsilon